VKVLHTERLTLRPFTAEDLDDLVKLDSDTEVMRFINGGAPTSREEVEREVLPHFLAYADGASGYGFWAAEERSTGAFVGWFHLRAHAGEGKPDEPELGYRLRRSAWGRGIATEGSRALINLAFSELGASRVYAETMSVNSASRRVMEKAGLRFVRLFHADWPVRIPGDEEGDVEYAITRQEWMRDRAAVSGSRTRPGRAP
jgi:RimJ/RimL family protein N-acetyltransferase